MIEERRARTRVADYESLVRQVELRHGIDRARMKPYIVALSPSPSPSPSPSRNPPGFRWRRLAVFLGILAGLLAWWWGVVMLVHWVWMLVEGMHLVTAGAGH